MFYSCIDFKNWGVVQSNPISQPYVFKAAFLASISINFVVFMSFTFILFCFGVQCFTFIDQLFDLKIIVSEFMRSFHVRYFFSSDMCFVCYVHQEYYHLLCIFKREISSI